MQLRHNHTVSAAGIYSIFHRDAGLADALKVTLNHLSNAELFLLKDTNKQTRKAAIRLLFEREGKDACVYQMKIMQAWCHELHINKSEVYFNSINAIFHGHLFALLANKKFLDLEGSFKHKVYCCQLMMYCLEYTKPQLMVTSEHASAIREMFPWPYPQPSSNWEELLIKQSIETQRSLLFAKEDGMDSFFSHLNGFNEYCKLGMEECLALLPDAQQSKTMGLIGAIITLLPNSDNQPFIKAVLIDLLDKLPGKGLYDSFTAKHFSVFTIASRKITDKQIAWELAKKLIDTINVKRRYVTAACDVISLAAYLLQGLSDDDAALWVIEALINIRDKRKKVIQQIRHCLLDIAPNMGGRNKTIILSFLYKQLKQPNGGMHFNWCELEKIMNLFASDQSIKSEISNYIFLKFKEDFGQDSLGLAVKRMESHVWAAMVRMFVQIHKDESYEENEKEKILTNLLSISDVRFNNSSRILYQPEQRSFFNLLSICKNATVKKMMLFSLINRAWKYPLTSEASVNLYKLAVLGVADHSSGSFVSEVAMQMAAPYRNLVYAYRALRVLERSHHNKENLMIALKIDVLSASTQVNHEQSPINFEYFADLFNHHHFDDWYQMFSPSVVRDNFVSYCYAVHASRIRRMDWLAVLDDDNGISKLYENITNILGETKGKLYEIAHFFLPQLESQRLIVEASLEMRVNEIDDPTDKHVVDAFFRRFYLRLTNSQQPSLNQTQEEVSEPPFKRLRAC